MVVLVISLESYRSLHLFLLNLVKVALVSGAAVALAADPVPKTDRNATEAPGGIEAFGEKFTVASRAPAAQARIFVYRLVASPRPEPVNIYLDGRYHTSLLRGGYSEFCMAQFQVPVQVASDDARQMHKGKQATPQLWSLQSGQTLFLKVQEGPDNRTTLVDMPAEQAVKELQSTAQQIHTVSRAPLAQPCQVPAPTPMPAETRILPVAPLAPLAPLPAVVPAAPVAKTVPAAEYALGADDLFDFGKSTLKPSGRKVIDALAGRLKRDFGRLDQIRLVGHSDPIGKDLVNQKLSLERAQTVLRELQNRGVVAHKGFTAAGKGAAQLVKTSCGKTPKPQNKACNAPNRRVEVAVTGTRR